MSIVLNALICSLIWSVMWSIYVFLILKFYPFSMLHDYPKDIQTAATIEKPTKAQEQAAKRFGAVGGLIIFGVLLAFGLLRFHGEQASFLQVLKYIFIIAMTWNVVDLLVMDWLIVCTITPKWIIIKGTEGCKGYKDYFFHFKGFLLGCVYTTIMALLFSGIDYAVLRFLIWK